MTFIDSSFSPRLGCLRRVRRGLGVWWTFALFLLVVGWAGGQSPAPNTAILRLADGSAQLPVPILKDAKGKAYLPLRDTAKFYGIDLQMDD